MLEYKQVALDFMNHDHAEFVALRESLLGLITQENVYAEIDALLEKLLTHTRHHFADEERQMQDAHFPPYPAHKGEHDQALGILQQRVAHWKQGRNLNDLKIFIEIALANWFVRHVNMMDFVTARFIANQANA